jgi:hypothetical protein
MTGFCSRIQLASPRTGMLAETTRELAHSRTVLTPVVIEFASSRIYVLANSQSALLSSSRSSRPPLRGRTLASEAKEMENPRTTRHVLPLEESRR